MFFFVAELLLGVLCIVMLADVLLRLQCTVCTSNTYVSCRAPLWIVLYHKARGPLRNRLQMLWLLVQVMIRRPFRIEADGWPNQAGQEISVKMGQTLTLSTRGKSYRGWLGWFVFLS